MRVWPSSGHEGEARALARRGLRVASPRLVGCGPWALGYAKKGARFAKRMWIGAPFAGPPAGNQRGALFVALGSLFWAVIGQDPGVRDSS